MPKQPLDFQDIVQLTELMHSSTQFSEFKMHAGGIEAALAMPVAQGITGQVLTVDAGFLVR